ncbi:MAG TPA: tetratricopeptide repeat protein, partial [Chloroflexota bacterium]
LARRGIEQVYNLQFEDAQQTFAALTAMRPHHPAGPFFTAMITWWRILIDIDDTRYDDEFYARLDHVIEMCDSLLDQNPDDVTAIFFKGGAIGFEGRLKFHRNDYLAAANAGRKALPLVQTAAELDPQNYDIELGTGMYNYYAEVVPSEYPWLKPLLLFVPPGDRQKGLRQIATAAEKGKYAAIEASYFLMQIYFYYEKDFGKALALCRDLFARFPHNMLFHRYLGRCQMSLSDWTGGRATFTEILRRVGDGWRGYTKNVEREAAYYLGLCGMNMREYDAALQYFYRCDELSRSLDAQEPSGFMVMANLKVGNIYDIQGKRALALEQYRKVLAMKEFKDSHKQAEQFINAPATY